MTTVPLAEVRLPLDTIPEGVPHGIELGDEAVVLVRRGNIVRAFAGTCPHVGAPLADGTICGGRLICPWHKAHFDIEDGAVLEPPALLGLARYPVEVRDGVVRVHGTSEAPAAAPSSRAVADSHVEVIAVVGSGAAAAAAISMLHERGYAGRTIVIGPESGRPPYDRTALSKMAITGDAPATGTDLRMPDGAITGSVERVPVAVRRLDAASRRIELADGRTITYDRALLASGGAPVRPDVQGIGLDGVHVLRSADDAVALVDALGRARTAVIVGNSFIGLEVASGLPKRGIDATVLGRDDVPFRAVFGAAIGARLRRLHENNGTRFVQGALGRIEGDGRAERVVLADGTILPADLVLLATGIRPNTDFVAGIDRDDDGGLSVDAGLRAVDGLWAAGDLARFPYRDGRIRVEHWAVATQHGRVAARNMLGEAIGYDGTPFFWTAQAGKRIDYVGHAADWDDIVVEGDLEAMEFLAFLVRLGKVEAAIGCGRDDAVARLTHAMRRRLSLDEARAVAAGG